MVSLKTVAKACGVSVATASKALRDQKDISAETKEKVRATAKSLGYLPNAAAQALKTRRFYNIGVLFTEEAGSGLTHEYFSGVLNGLRKEAERSGYDITFINTGLNCRGMTYYQHCRYRNFEGVAVVCSDPDDPQTEELKRGDIPVVLVDDEYEGCASVRSNNEKGIRDLVDYVCGLGHRRIAYIHGQSGLYVTGVRLEAFLGAAAAHGLAIPEDYLGEACYLTGEGVAGETERLLSLPEPPTCIFFPDDTALIAGRAAILSAGLRIPADVSIVGYDGTKVSQLLDQHITTIRQDVETIGQMAARSLIQMIERGGTAEPADICVDGVLIEGDSVGVPRKA